MRLGKNLKGRKVVELSVMEFAEIYETSWSRKKRNPEEHPPEYGVSRQFILKMIQNEKLPMGVTAHKLGRSYIIQSTRKEDIGLLTKK